MSATPFMQLYVADYLGDTRHLTTEQHGAYLLLLMAMWRAGGKLPADDEKLARIAGLALARWKRTCGDVMAFFTLVNGEITQKRLAAEIKKSQEKSQKRAEAGRLGGQAKSLKNNDEAEANATVLPQHSSDTRSHIEEPSVPSSSSFHSDDPSSARGRDVAPKLELLPPAEPFGDVIAEALAAYNVAAKAVGWPVAQVLNGRRRSALKARLADCGGFEGWQAAMAKAVGSPFLCGENDRGWLPDLDFFLQAKSFIKLMEGGYDRRAGNFSGGSGSHSRPSAARSVVGGFAQALAEHPGSDFGRAARAQGFAGPDDC